MINKNQFKTIVQLVRRFPDEKSCHQYLAGQRWDSGVLECPHEGCGHDEAYVFKDGIRYKCKGCKRLYTARTNTFMHGSNLSTLTWFMAMYLVLHKKGVSSIQLGKDLGVTQKTAWFILHRVRWALGNEPEEQLDGVIEVDETFVGGASKFKHKNKRARYDPDQGWRTWHDKVPIMGVLRRKTETQESYVVARVIPNVKSGALNSVVRKHIAKGATVMTDGYRGYNCFWHWFNVKEIDHSVGQYVSGDVYTNTIEGFWSQFKKGIKSTYHKTTRKHLQKYANEFTFKYNYRNLDAEQQLQCIIKNMNCRLKYKDLIAA